MFCSKCGTRVKDGAKFCPNCGEKIIGVQTPYVQMPGQTADPAPVPEAPAGIEIPVPAAPVEEAISDAENAVQAETTEVISEAVIEDKAESVVDPANAEEQETPAEVVPEETEAVPEETEIVSDAENAAEDESSVISEDAASADAAGEAEPCEENAAETTVTDIETEETEAGEPVPELEIPAIAEAAADETVVNAEEVTAKEEIFADSEAKAEDSAAANTDTAVPGESAEAPAVQYNAQPVMPAGTYQQIPVQNAGQAPVQQNYGYPNAPAGAYSGQPQPAANGSQAQAYAQYVQSFVPEPPKKKKGWLIALIAVLLIALIGGGAAWYFVKARPEKQRQELIQSYLDEGSSYYNARLLEDAAECYEKVLEIDPENPEAKQNLYTTLHEQAVNLLYEERYEEARDNVFRMAEINGSNDVTDGMLSDIYNAWITHCADNGELENGLKILDEASPYLTDDDYIARLEELKAINESGSQEPEVAPPVEDPSQGEEPDPYTQVVDRESFAKRIAEICDQGHYDSGALLLLVYEETATDGMNPGDREVIKLEGYEYDYLEIVMRDTDYYVYYGMMDPEGVRNGIGWVLSYTLEETGYGVYMYIAQWENGQPNGDFYEFVLYADGTGDQYSGKVKNGLYDGRITMKYRDGLTYYGEFENGRVKDPQVDENGKVRYFATEDGVNHFDMTEEQAKTIDIGLDIR